MKRIKLHRITGIDEDCWLLIFSYLFTNEIVNLRYVCKLFNFVTRQSIVWKVKLNSNVEFEKFAKMFEPMTIIPNAIDLKKKTKEVMKHSNTLNFILENVLQIINIMRLSGYYGIGFRIKRVGDNFEFLYTDLNTLNCNNSYIIEKSSKTFVLKLKDINDIHFFNGNNLSFNLKSFFTSCEKIYKNHGNEIFKQVTKKMERQRYHFSLEFTQQRCELFFYVYWGNPQYCDSSDEDDDEEPQEPEFDFCRKVPTTEVDFEIDEDELKFL